MCRAKNIQNKARINEDPKDAMLREFQREIEELRRQLAEEAEEEGEGEGEGEGDRVRRKKRRQRKGDSISLSPLLTSVCVFHR